MSNRRKRTRKKGAITLRDLDVRQMVDLQSSYKPDEFSRLYEYWPGGYEQRGEALAAVWREALVRVSFICNLDARFPLSVFDYWITDTCTGTDSCLVYGRLSEYEPCAWCPNRSPKTTEG